MTNANMKLIILQVNLEDKLEIPDQKLDAGEFIVRRIVELAKLEEELQGKSRVHPDLEWHSLILTWV
jgi:ADP-ribose pyrophosphatase